MKKFIATVSLLSSVSAFAANPWSFTISLDKPYFQSPTQSSVSIQQSPYFPEYNTIANQNKNESAPWATSASLTYTFYVHGPWQLRSGVQAAFENSPISGVGKIGDYTLDTYNYRVNAQSYDGLMTADYQMKHYIFGADLLLGFSSLQAGHFNDVLDSATQYASKSVTQLSYGVQIHALYQITPHWNAGVQAGYRNDGMSSLGARANVYQSTGSIKQTIASSYVGALLGLQF
jgi:hypothetical protein